MRALSQLPQPGSDVRVCDCRLIQLIACLITLVVNARSPSREDGTARSTRLVETKVHVLANVEGLLQLRESS